MKKAESGSHVPILSGQAITETAGHISQIVGRHGPRAVALYQGTFALFYPAPTPDAPPTVFLPFVVRR